MIGYVTEYYFSIKSDFFKYNMTGKFKALSPEWKHDHAPLIDYELIIVTEGEFFLSYQGHYFHIAKSGYPKISLDTMYTSIISSRFMFQNSLHKNTLLQW